MNSAEYVASKILELKQTCKTLDEAAWELSKLCLGWAYVFGERGQYCTPANRRRAYNHATGQNQTNIKKRCKNFDSTGSCSGCQWYPGGKKTREFDCRGFTYWVLLQIFGWELMGTGCTKQWDDKNNWKAKGDIKDGIPQDTIICLYYYERDKQGKKTGKLEHTGLYFNGETTECQRNVEYSKTLNKKWEVWGIPACSGGVVPPVPPVPPEPPVPEGYAVVTGKNVALRQDPSLRANIILRVKTGEKVKLETPPDKEWDYVSYGKNTGWMMRAYLREEVDHAIVTGKKVALRKDPSLKAEIIMRINTGETVKLETEPESQWDYVSYNGRIGYMMKEFLSEG